MATQKTLGRPSASNGRDRQVPTQMSDCRWVLGVRELAGHRELLLKCLGESVDRKSVGSIEWRDTVEVPVEPGRHTIRVGAGRHSSQDHSFEAADGEVVTFCIHHAWSGRGGLSRCSSPTWPSLSNTSSRRGE